jgi:YVTN family beta-propeller protein
MNTDKLESRVLAAVRGDAWKKPVLAVMLVCLLTPASSRAQNAYITNFGFGGPGTVSVIDTTTDTVIATIPAGIGPAGVAVTPDGSKAYVANEFANTVSAIDSATNTVSATIPVGLNPWGVAVTPDGSKVYVANEFANTVSVIDTATNTVSATVPVGDRPIAFGIFIQPPPRFAGVPGSNNCHGTSVSALAIKYGGLDAAAAALGYSTVQGLQNAISAFCEG